MRSTRSPRPGASVFAQEGADPGARSITRCPRGWRRACACADSVLERVLGPIAIAKATLEPQGRWEGVRADLASRYEEVNEATDGTLGREGEYLLTVARR